MKNVVFLFQEVVEDTPQVSWAVQEYIDPGVHQVLLVYVLPEKLLLLNDPRTLADGIGVLSYEEETRRSRARRRLEDIQKTLLAEFSRDLHVSKLVICGPERERLRIVLGALEASLVILGPDTVQSRLSAFFFESLDDFLSKKLNVPVLRVPPKLMCGKLQ